MPFVLDPQIQVNILYEIRLITLFFPHGKSFSDNDCPKEKEVARLIQDFFYYDAPRR